MFLIFDHNYRKVVFQKDALLIKEAKTENVFDGRKINRKISIVAFLRFLKRRFWRRKRSQITFYF